MRFCIFNEQRTWAGGTQNSATMPSDNVGFYELNKMMLELLKTTIPFLLGLIPFFISMFYTRKINDEISKQQYRIKFYEKQFESLCEINIALNKFHKEMHFKYATFGISNEWIDKENDKPLLKLYKDTNSRGIKALLSLFESRDKYEILLPTFFLVVLNEYLSFGAKYFAFDKLRDTQYGKDIHLIQSDDDFLTMWNEQNTRFNQLLIWIRLLSGVEGISDKIFSHVEKKDGKYTVPVKEYKLNER